jgi:hypothetical protein
MEPLLDKLARQIDTKPLNHIRRGRFSHLWMLPLAFLPGLLLIASLKYFNNASGWVKRCDAFLVCGLLTALCSLVIAFYLIQQSSLPGLRRVVATILLSVVLYCTADVVTLVLELTGFGVAV